jgi:hypothetical protein
MDRRTAIKQFVIISAGAALIPSCISHSPETISEYSQLPITEDQQNLMAALGDNIIPSEPNSPGARDVSATVFALTMLNDCFSDKDREKFMKGLVQFDTDVRKLYGRSFESCSKAYQDKIVSRINSQQHAQDDASFFYHTMKHLTLEAYTSSQYFLTKIHLYKLVPGPYISHVTV